MKNVKLLMLLLLLVAGVSFAAGRSNRRTREKIGNTERKVYDRKERKYCGKDESGIWYTCDEIPE